MTDLPSVSVNTVSRNDLLSPIKSEDNAIGFICLFVYRYNSVVDRWR